MSDTLHEYISSAVRDFTKKKTIKKALDEIYPDKSAYYRKMRSPEKLTVQDLIKFSKITGISEQDLFTNVISALQQDQDKFETLANRKLKKSII